MVEIEELRKTNLYGKVRVVILTYKGEGDPIQEIDNELEKYVYDNNVYKDKKYREFIDRNMDNPWVRVVVFGEVE